jgi:integrase
MPATTRKTTPRLHNGVMKRGTTWSYVIRVKDPETGISKPRLVAASPPSKTPRPRATKPA